MALPKDWQPDEADRAYAEERGLDPDIARKAFVNYFVNGRGSREKREDWRLSWEVWCDRDAKSRAGPVRETWEEKRRRENLAVIQEYDDRHRTA
jgi:hypothetical protein